MITKNGTVYDYSELYEVSNKEGRIRSVKTGKILKPGKDKYGYSHVALCKDGKTSRFQVHRLVATMFIPNPNNKPVVNHKDENPSNNSADNLEWVTQKENLNYGTAQQRRSEAIKGGKNYKARKVRCIETKQVFDTITEASNWYQQETGGGVITGMIVRCCKGKKKTAGGYTWEYVD
jgi:hypothetical protein